MDKNRFPKYILRRLKDEDYVWTLNSDSIEELEKDNKQMETKFGGKKKK